MTNKREKEILERISESLKRRQVLDLSARQIKEIADRSLSPIHQDQMKIVKNRQQRPVIKQREAFSLPSDDRSAIFLTGGIGDIFALESFFTDDDRAKLPIIYYATRKSQELEVLFRSLPNYPLLKDHVLAWSDFSAFWGFYFKEECIAKMKGRGVAIPQSLSMARDWSIAVKFPQIKEKAITYNNSSFLLNTVSCLSKFNLPKKYITICPCSNDKRLIGRDFDGVDWSQTVAFLNRSGLEGVVLGVGTERIPSNGLVHDLKNKTTIPEAVEILKLSEGYIGIDTALSVLAAKLFESSHLRIKSINKHLYDNTYCYYAPKTEYSFISESIRFV